MRKWQKIQKYTKNYLSDKGADNKKSPENQVIYTEILF